MNLFSNIDHIAGSRRARYINANVPFVEPIKIRLNSFQWSELRVFASCVYLDVQFTHRSAGFSFDTKEDTCLQLESMRNCYKEKHKEKL
jgi:hypothetical protein